jgi:hypothetical protein
MTTAIAGVKKNTLKKRNNKKFLLPLLLPRR